MICDFDVLEIERTDFLPLTGCAQRQVADMRVSYMNAQDKGSLEDTHDDFDYGYDCNFCST
jgi:hypothetical protein